MARFWSQLELVSEMIVYGRAVIPHNERDVQLKVSGRERLGDGIERSWYSGAYVMSTCLRGRVAWMGVLGVPSHDILRHLRRHHRRNAANHRSRECLAAQRVTSRSRDSAVHNCGSDRFRDPPSALDHFHPA